jgi:hypothetical protein
VFSFDKAHQSPLTITPSQSLDSLLVDGKIVKMRRANGLSETIGPVFTVLLEKSPNKGLGISIAGGINTTFGAVFVAKIFPDTPAALSGLVHVGDRLISVQNQVRGHD